MSILSFSSRETLPHPLLLLRAAASIVGERATIIIIVVQRIFRNYIERDHGRSHKRSLAKRYNLRSAPLLPLLPLRPVSPLPDASATNRGIKLGVALLHLRMTLVVKPFRRELFYLTARNDRREGTTANRFYRWFSVTFQLAGEGQVIGMV